jgi:hypothetical protein
MRELNSKKAAGIAGLATLTEMLHMLGKGTDHDLAEIFVENEMHIRAMIEMFAEQVKID